MLNDREITIGQIEILTTPELKNVFQRLFEKPPPKRASQTFLRANIAYRLQENSHGGIPTKTKKKLLSIARSLEKDPGASVVPGPTIKPGTRLVRRWQDETHLVTVLEDGYEYQGQRFRSLSKIATEITGTKWSGPVFFGLKKNGKG